MQVITQTNACIAYLGRTLGDYAHGRIAAERGFHFIPAEALVQNGTAGDNGRRTLNQVFW